MLRSRSVLTLLAVCMSLLGLRWLLASPATPQAVCAAPSCQYAPVLLKAPPPTPTPTPPPPTATPTLPVPTATPTPPPPTATPPAMAPTCDLPVSANVPNTPIQIVDVDKRAEQVLLHNVSAQTVDLSGWWICSITGHQLHAVLSGQLAPGQLLNVPSQAGVPIWNNTSTDPAALFNRQGVQISYRVQ